MCCGCSMLKWRKHASRPNVSGIRESSRRFERETECVKQCGRECLHLALALLSMQINCDTAHVKLFSRANLAAPLLDCGMCAFTCSRTVSIEQRACSLRVLRQSPQQPERDKLQLMKKHTAKPSRARTSINAVQPERWCEAPPPQGQLQPLPQPPACISLPPACKRDRRPKLLQLQLGRRSQRRQHSAQARQRLRRMAVSHATCHTCHMPHMPQKSHTSHMALIAVRRAGGGGGGHPMTWRPVETRSKCRGAQLKQITPATIQKITCGASNTTHALRRAATKRGT